MGCGRTLSNIINEPHKNFGWVLCFRPQLGLAGDQQLALSQLVLVDACLSFDAVDKHELAFSCLELNRLLLLDDFVGEISLAAFQHQIEVRHFAFGCGVPVPAESVDVPRQQDLTITALVLDFHPSLQHRDHSVHIFELCESGVLIFCRCDAEPELKVPFCVLAVLWINV